MLETLLLPEDIVTDFWHRLRSACDEVDNPLHTPAVASMNEMNGVTVRSVVLRKVDSQTRRLVFHTDRRSPKFADLLNDPTVAWLFYDPAIRLQLRIHTRATLHTNDAVAQEQWATLPERSRQMYRTPLPPGAAVDHMLLEPPAPHGDGRDHFAVVACRIESIDWLYLHPKVHRRARFGWEDEQLICQWLAP